MKGFYAFLTRLYGDFNRKSYSIQDLISVMDREGVSVRTVTLEEFLLFVEKMEGKKCARAKVKGKIAEQRIREKIERAKIYFDHEFKAAIVYKQMKHGLHDVPVIYFNASKPNGVVWFAIGHEAGHYFLHPFFDWNLPELHEKNGREDENYLGLLELEADLFSNTLFIPDTFFDPFKARLVKGFKNGDREEILTIKGEMLYASIKETYIKLSIDGKKAIPRRALLNLKIRIHRYLSDLRERMIIVCEDCDIRGKDYNLEDIDNAYAKYCSFVKEDKS